MPIAADLLAEGRCTASCLLALVSEAKCACRCDGDYHGLLADAEVPLSVRDLAHVTLGAIAALHIRLPVTRAIAPVFEALKYTLASHPGSVPVVLELVAKSGGDLCSESFALVDTRLRVSDDPQLERDLTALLGPSWRRPLVSRW